MKKRFMSFVFAGRGIKAVFKSEPNMQIHLFIGILVVLFGILLSISVVEWLVCVLCFGMVIGAEMFNTAIEVIVDLVSPNHHILAGKAKDIAAGAVLVCSFFSAIAGLIIFMPKVWCFIQTLLQNYK